MTEKMAMPLHAQVPPDSICRVCRSEGLPDNPLYHPCVCTGSIKYIHQECLVQWLNYSKKEYCELCNHPYSFAPVYSEDMPTHLPMAYLLMGIVSTVSGAIKYWTRFVVVSVAWLLFVPLTAFRFYFLVFTEMSQKDVLHAFSLSHILVDALAGCFVVLITLTTFVSIVWLRDQILVGGGPAWLMNEVVRPAERAPARNRARFAFRNRQAVQQPAAAGAQPPVAAAAAEAPQGPRVVNLEDQNELPVGGVDVEPADDLPDALRQAIDVNNAAIAENNNNNNDDHWNLLDFDRAEEMSWERLLGFDGSLIFLEHLFWVICLNFIFIITFAFIPFHIGKFTLRFLDLGEKLQEFKLNFFLSFILGYFVIAVLLVILLTIFSLTHKNKIKRLVGICYTMIKVSLLVIVELGLFPIICGCWLDICSLGMFCDSFKDRMKSFDGSPVSFLFIRWLVGMIYVFYFASFILLLREVIRPGVLYFIRNINDPDFSPVQEMIHLPIYLHVRRFTASLLVFGSIVVIMLWFPIKAIKFLFPNFLPFNVKLSNDTPIHELSLELILLQVVLPALLEQA